MGWKTTSFYRKKNKEPGKESRKYLLFRVRRPKVSLAFGDWLTNVFLNNRAFIETQKLSKFQLPDMEQNAEEAPSWA